MFSTVDLESFILVFFFFYTIGFIWCFDKAFGLPQSAQGINA